MLTHYLISQPRINLLKNHRVNFTGGIIINTPYNAIGNNYLTDNGYIVGAGYNANLFNNKWKFNVASNYQQGNSFVSYYKRLNGAHTSKIKVARETSIDIVNTLNSYQSYIDTGILQQNLTSTNTLNFNTDKRRSNFTPGLFYNINIYDTINFHNRGLNFSISDYDFSKNLQLAVNTRIGLSNWYHHDPVEYFNTSNSLYVRYKTFSTNVFYKNWTNSPSTILITNQTGKTPQDLRLSFSHQYLFKNKIFLLRTNFSYFYSNINHRQAINFTPTFNYYTYSGWRFQIRSSLTYNSSRFEQIANENSPDYLKGGAELSKTSNSSVSFSIGIRKDFGILMPGKENKYHNAVLKSFYDINGNGVMDGNEKPIPNVVVSLGETQVLTNEFGTAVIQNVSPDVKQFIAISLEDLKGWFPLIEDSIAVLESKEVMIPFVKGIKVIGKNKLRSR